MKIEIIKEKLLKAVSDAERIAGNHVSLPVLSCILFHATKNELVVKATNLDVGIEIKIPAKVSEEGIVAISGSYIKSFLLNSEDAKEVLVEKQEGVCKFTSGKTVASIKIESHEDFPIIPKVEENQFVLSVDEFLSGVKSVWWATSTSQIKPEISSVYIYENNGEMVFVATDSFRLAEKRIKSKKVSHFEPMLIPYKNIVEVIRTFDQAKGEIEIRASKNQISFVLGGIHITSRLIDGNFPDYKQIIPKEHTTKATVISDEFFRAIKLTGVFADTFHQAELKVLVSKKKISLRASNSLIGEANEEILGSFEGEDISMTLNQKYLMDGAQSLQGNHISFFFNGVGKPILIKDAEYKGFLYLVMPMNK